MRGRTLAELSALTRVPPATLLPVLLDERARGHVELANGRWHATERVRREYGAAFNVIRPLDTQRRRNDRHP